MRLSAICIVCGLISSAFALTARAPAERSAVGIVNAGALLFASTGVAAIAPRRLLAMRPSSTKEKREWSRRDKVKIC